MATIKDVARRAGVSTSTISKYINGGNVRAENAEAIREAIAALDFRVNPFARSLKTQRSKSIGVLLPDITAPFFGSVVKSLDRTLRESGYHSLISCYSSSHGLERDNLQFLLNNGIDGLVYAPEDLSSEEIQELTANCSIPIVQVDRMIQGVFSDTVLVDNTDAIYRSVLQLIARGHRRIAIVTGPKAVFTARERLVGYLRALSDQGIRFDDSLVFSAEYAFSTAHTAFEKMMQLSDPPTAVISTNHDFTVGLVTAAREQGKRIPEDIDIFGFDCVDICTMLRPPIPVVHQPEEEIGKTAARYMIDRLEGYSGPPRVTRFKCSILPD